MSVMTQLDFTFQLQNMPKNFAKSSLQPYMIHFKTECYIHRNMLFQEDF